MGAGSIVTYHVARFGGATGKDKRHGLAVAVLQVLRVGDLAALEGYVCLGVGVGYGGCEGHRSQGRNEECTKTDSHGG